jgi:hypothetical protein
LLKAFPAGAFSEHNSHLAGDDLMTTRKPILSGASRLLVLGLTITAAPLLARCAAPNIGNAVVAGVPCDPNGEFAQRLMIPNVPASLTCLHDIPTVNSDLFNTTVVDAYGYHVGRFRRVEVKAPGDVVAVITLNDSLRTISVLTDHLRYEPGSRVMIADLTTREMDLIPSGFPYG